ncbi:hypothetical protein PFISCL1PPCAC_8332, partial [Pristionchus fissidentatus]
PLLPYTHIHTTEQLPLYRDGERESKIDLTIRRNWNRHRLVLLDFLVSDCYSGVYYRLRLDENTYINLPDDGPSPPITLTDFYRQLQKFVSSGEETVAEISHDGQIVILKFFESAPLLFLDRLNDIQMMEIIHEATSEIDKATSILREQFRSRWSKLTAQILHSSPKAALLKPVSSEATYLTALRYGLSKSPAAAAAA